MDDSSDGDNHNHRGDSNDNSQHRQNGSAAIAFNIHQGYFYVFP